MANIAGRYNKPSAVYGFGFNAQFTPLQTEVAKKKRFT
jgi:hypothetical protein